MTGSTVKVLIVDDSVFARKIVADVLDSSPEIEVVGTAVDGKDALVKIPELNPDVVTLDIEMPNINGLETLKRIMQEHPVPVVMLSSLTVSGAKESIQALRYGAVDLMAKPHGSHSMGLTMLREEIISKVISASKVDVGKLKHAGMGQASKAAPPRKVDSSKMKSKATPIVLIASSTGGPRALRTIVPDLTTDAGVAYVVVQHLPDGFSAAMAADLNNDTALNVREAADGDVICPGDLIFAKAGSHLVWDAGNKLRLTQTPPLWGVRPSADVTMVSAAPIYRDRIVGVVLTGMGKDGADGITEIKKYGGYNIAEDESTCVVFGMPRAAIETGKIDKVVPLNKMAKAINLAVVENAQAHGWRREAA